QALATPTSSGDPVARSSLQAQATPTSSGDSVARCPPTRNGQLLVRSSLRAWRPGPVGLCLVFARRRCASTTAAFGGTTLVFFVGAALGAGQVDAELLRCAEDVLVELTHLDLFTSGGEDLDVEAQRLHLLDEHLEALGDAGL